MMAVALKIDQRMLLERDTNFKKFGDFRSSEFESICFVSKSGIWNFQTIQAFMSFKPYFDK